MQTPLQDLSLSMRSLRRSPGFAVTAILILSLGIGSVTAVFSVVNSVLLKPFAFADPDRLVVLRETTQEQNHKPGPDNYKHYLHWKANSRTLADVAIFANQGYSVAAGTDHPEIVGGLGISPNFFSLLGVAPALGRSFRSEEATTGRDDVVILSWSAWQRYFHGDPSAIGRTLRLGGTPSTVVGVLPQNFTFPHMNEMPAATSQGQLRPYEIFRPLNPPPSQRSDSGDYDFLVIGRLRAAVSRAQAESELQSLQEGFARAAHLPEHLAILVEPLKQEVAGRVSKALWLLLAAVAAVLLIGCVNLANLQLARAVAREREMALRAALGAGRTRLLWSALTDSVVLAAVGGALGTLLAFLGVRLFVAAAPSSLPRLSEVHVSGPALLAAAAISILTALLFGLLPALRAMRTDPQTAMQTNTSRAANSRDGRRTRNLLVAGEIACTVVLLIVTGLLVRSFSRLLTQQRDFDAHHITLAQVSLYAPRYADTQKDSAILRAAFADRALNDLTQLPGAQSVALTSEMPLAGETWIDALTRPDHPVAPGHELPANMRWISPSYIDTLQIPLLAGRNLQPGDREHPTNALISRQTARTVWPGEDPLGKTFKTGDTTVYTVVGVVADARINDLKATASMVYLPYWENPWWRVYFLIRTPQPTAAVADSIRRTLWNIDPEIAIPTLKSFDDQVSDSTATERFQTVLLSSFGLSALALAVLGVYGVLTYSVSVRQQEFGIRMALGSGKSALVRLVMRQAAAPIIAGLFLGLALSIAATRWVQSLLYETQVINLPVISSAIAVLLGSALLATWLPARRAAGVNPMQALRSE